VSDFLKKISTYTLANTLNKGVIFLLIPFLTAYLTLEEQGALSLFTTSLAVLSPLVALQITGAINVEYFRKEFGEAAFPRYVSSALAVSFFSFLMLSTVVVLFRDELYDFLELQPLYLLILPFVAFLVAWLEVLKVNYIIRGQAIRFGVFLLGLTLLDLLLSITLVAKFDLGVVGRIWGVVAPKIIFGFIAARLLFKGQLLTRDVRKIYLKDVLRFGIPLLPHALGGIMLHSADQFFIKSMVGLEELGVYSIAYRIGSVIMLIDVSFNQAFSPFMFRGLKVGSKPELVKILRIAVLYAIGLVACSIMLYLLLPYLYHFFVDQRYHAGQVYVMWIAMGYVLLGIYKVFTNFLFFHKKTRIVGAITISCAMLNIAMNYFFIQKFGTIGAAYSTLISFFAFLIATGVAAHQYNDFPWREVFKLEKHD